MSKRKALIRESLRWPNAFANLEAMQSLAQHRGWAHLLADLRELHQQLSHRIVHEIHPTPEGQAEQNFMRGEIIVCERLLEFEEEMKEWQESSKG